METDGVIRACKQDTGLAMFLRRVVQVMHADNIGIQNCIEVILDRDTAQVENAITALDQAVDEGAVAQVAAHDFFLVRYALDRSDVGEPDRGGKISIWLTLKPDELLKPENPEKDSKN
jgi:hypothetical protein